jgi:hypothetical protein
MRALSDDQIQQFIQDGFVRIDRAFPREIAHEARAILWRDTGCDPDDPATWTKPVIRLSGYKGAPFLKAERMPVLHAGFDQIVGKRRWRLGSLGFGGMFVARFPHPGDPGDDGWHIDTSFPPDGGDSNERSDFSAWRANVRSRGYALLMLFLFLRRRPAGRADADTGGSHIDMARFLAPAGEAGMSPKDMVPDQPDGRRPARGLGDRRRRDRLPVPSLSRPPRAAPPEGRRRGSWPSRRCIPRNPSGSIGWTAIIHQLRSLFAKLFRERGSTNQLRPDPKRRPSGQKCQ